jgi:hypothetical protein
MGILVGNNRQKAMLASKDKDKDKDKGKYIKGKG